MSTVFMTDPSLQISIHSHMSSSSLRLAFVALEALFQRLLKLVLKPLISHLLVMVVMSSLAVMPAMASAQIFSCLA
jgi:hypothetical protein